MAAGSNPAPPEFDEFPAATHADWLQAAGAALPGAATPESLSTDTLEGLWLRPIYIAGDVAHIQHQHSAPGTSPGVRGGTARARPWLIVQASAQAESSAVNGELRHDLAQGGTAVALLPDEATLRCLDPNLASPEEIGRGGCSLACADDFGAALAGISPGQTPLQLQCGARSLPVAALLLAAFRRRGEDLVALRGAVGADPLAWLARVGSLPAAPETLYDEQAIWLRWCSQHAPALDAIFLDSRVWHEAGANAVQELACTLANGASTLRQMLARGLAVDDVAARMCVSPALGGDFLMELAKLRAARLLWSQMVEAFGGSVAAQGLTLHARTGRRNKSALDCWSNMLRSTQEALCGAIGGCDSLMVEPCDAMLRPANDFARRHARNQQLILQHEVGLARLQDPAGGSWTIEAMTDWLARESWAAFQRIEADGGLLASLRAGSVQREIAAVAQQRAQRNARRADVLVGNNQFAEEREFVPGSDTADSHEFASGRIAQFEARQRTALATVPGLNIDAEIFAILLRAAERGATLTQLADALPDRAGERVTVTPLASQRLARPWEALRANASAHRARGGVAARVYLALTGGGTSLQARVDFVKDFFQAGGFVCETGGPRSLPREAADDAIKAGAPAVVICAPDDAPGELVPDFCARMRERSPQTLLYYAGRPEAGRERELRAAGIEDFVHLRADCLNINRRLQQRTGIVP